MECVCAECLCLKKRADEVYKSKREDTSAGAYNTQNNKQILTLTPQSKQSSTHCYQENNYACMQSDSFHPFGWR